MKTKIRRDAIPVALRGLVSFSSSAEEFAEIK
jgi:hypothetical protein